MIKPFKRLKVFLSGVRLVTLSAMSVIVSVYETRLSSSTGRLVTEYATKLT